jgi:periodic tryptophan protein 2
VKQVKFSPDGSQFAIASTEGLIIYSISNYMQQSFQPYDIDETITIDNIIENIKNA